MAKGIVLAYRRSNRDPERMVADSGSARLSC
jgi:hypothetical protein